MGAGEVDSCEADPLPSDGEGDGKGKAVEVGRLGVICGIPGAPPIEAELQAVTKTSKSRKQDRERIIIGHLLVTKRPLPYPGSLPQQVILPEKARPAHPRGGPPPATPLQCSLEAQPVFQPGESARVCSAWLLCPAFARG
uniref:Uncharacterized protein n=1 Tax=uncultured Chloroflexota bacterium TaxID=166587 RepID=H5SK73_9CHLR|nr:hypothetical protein [uncultured bacterium]BAL56559.1 hypothetical protein HGMM_F40G09C06 [uncultured Chloroflexota bacterium]